MREERLEVSVTFDERGYIGSAPELRQAVVALAWAARAARSRRCCCPSRSDLLHLDGLAERERHRRQA